METCANVQLTNDDATQCKLSAVLKKYYEDPFLLDLLNVSNKSTIPHKDPEILRGYFTRVQSIMLLMKNCLSLFSRNLSDNSISQITHFGGDEKCIHKQIGGSRERMNVQVVNIGAGYDTLFWRLRDKVPVNMNLHLFELDLSDVVRRKVQCIRKSKLLKASFKEVEQLSDFELHCKSDANHTFHLLSADLNDVQSVEKALVSNCSSSFSFSNPTIFVSECVLVYLTDEKSSLLLNWINTSFKSFVFFIDHSQIGVDDNFGHVMVSHLSDRQILVPGLKHCQSVGVFQNHFTESGGFVECQIRTMLELYKEALVDGGSSEIERVEKLQILDEMDVMNQLFSHYCISISFNSSVKTDLLSTFQSFDMFECFS